MANKRQGPITWFITQEFLQRAMAICMGIFLLQYVNWMMKEVVVWEETTAILIKYTLFGIGATYFIPRIPNVIRGAIQIVVVIVITGFYLDYKFIPLTDWKWSKVLPFIDGNMLQLMPYLWFTLGAALVYVVSIWGMSKKLWMYLGIFGSILALCIRDSFSNLSLWKEIAVVLFCSTMIVVITNLVRIQKHSPDAWRKLSQRPFPILIPVVLIAVIFYSIVQYTPSIRPILTDPYTAWKNYNGEQVAKFTTDEGGSLFTNQDSLAESGYSRSDESLGGGFKYNYRTVMKVTSTQRSYWRGETRSVYTGSGWEKDPKEQDNRVDVKLWEAIQPDPRVDTSKASLNTFTYTVTMLSEDDYPVLFGPNRIQQLLEIKGKDGQNNPSTMSRITWTPNDAVMNFKGNSGYPTSYMMISQVPVIDVPELRKVKLEDVSAELWQDYLQIPETMPVRIKELAQQITQNSATPYDKVKNIERFLAGNFVYNTEPAKGTSQDFVDQFLFEVKEGYCDYYSTAMVMLTRSIGMPARWVKGFSTGTSLLEEMMERGGYRGAAQRLSSTSDEFTVRNADAHSWAEVYFPGWGWVPFEPTSGFTMPTVLVNNEGESIPTPPVANVDAAVDATDVGWNWRMWTFIFGIVLLIGLITFLVIKFLPWRNAMNLVRRTRYSGNYNQMVVHDVYRLLQYAKRKGFERESKETTLRETLTRWMQTNVWLERELTTLLILYERAHYSGAMLTEAEWFEALRTIRKLRIAMK